MTIVSQNARKLFRDAVAAPPRAPAGLGDGLHALDQAQLDQALQRACRLGADGLLDLAVLGGAGSDRAQHELAEVAPVALGREHQLTLVEKLPAGAAHQPREVLPHAARLIPPGEVQRDAAEDAPHECAIGG